MKGLFILAAVMTIGAMLMLVCSYKLLSELDTIKNVNPGKDALALKTEMQPYVVGSYLGLTLLLAGGLGAIILFFRSWSRRF